MAEDEHHDEQPIIVVKRVIKKGGHHGGSWKLAYADFVTAMMAFFLLLWLLSLMDQNKLQGISNYFKKPMRDLFIENQMHDTNIPKLINETKKKKKEISPLKLDQSKPAMGKYKANDKSIASSTLQEKEATKLEMANIADPTEVEEPSYNQTEDSSPGKEEKAANDDITKLKARKKELIQALNAEPSMSKYKEHLDFEIVADGLKINIKSLKGRPMFSQGDIDFNRYAKHIITWLAEELNKSPQKITIIGHTDSHPNTDISGRGNWELSTSRANATRSYLLKKGMEKDKIIRIQGAADTNLYDKHNSEAPSNRRIEIILLTDDAVERYLNQ